MPTILAERLQAEARKSGLTQEKLAREVGISREQCGKQLRKTGPSPSKLSWPFCGATGRSQPKADIGRHL